MRNCFLLFCRNGIYFFVLCFWSLAQFSVVNAAIIIYIYKKNIYIYIYIYIYKGNKHIF